jgi:hypothetical protein
VNGRAAEHEPAAASGGAMIDERDLTPITLEEAKRRASRELTDRLGPDAEVVAIRLENCKSIEEFRERVREAERLIAAVLGQPVAQEYLRALRRR